MNFGRRLIHQMTGVQGVADIWLDALDKQDVGALEGHALSPEASLELQWRMLHFCREAILRLAREIDELRATGAGGDDLG
jgi:hypothetical protein